mmetsp:Transcript_22210/g.37098  ORF Transcript_22210/g.37098 Transcript_22210/m.37098 type:complete len:206 (+) Transcript_22210:508-1125(+)
MYPLSLSSASIMAAYIRIPGNPVLILESATGLATMHNTRMFVALAPLFISSSRQATMVPPVASIGSETTINAPSSNFSGSLFRYSSASNVASLRTYPTWYVIDTGRTWFACSIGTNPARRIGTRMTGLVGSIMVASATPQGDSICRSIVGNHSRVISYRRILPSSEMAARKGPEGVALLRAMARWCLIRGCGGTITNIWLDCFGS